jgi:hypothetical protein
MLNTRLTNNQGIETTYEITPSLQLSLTTYHRGQGRYVTSIKRQTVARGFVSFTLFADTEMLGQDTIGARFSKKNLEAIHDRYIPQITDFIEWAKDKSQED